MFDMSRHKEVFNPYTFQQPVHVVGCGGMGSRIAEGLVRMGVGIENQSPIVLYDGDIFEPHNLSNQWVIISRLYKRKVHATREMMHEINPQAHILTCANWIEDDIRAPGVVFICVDSMYSRRQIVDTIENNTDPAQCIIEVRMDAGVGVVHCFDPCEPQHLACWRMYWHSDDEAENMQGCGGPQSIISAVYATTAMALKRFEQFARTGTVLGSPNRIYQDFDACEVRSEIWPFA